MDACSMFLADHARVHSATIATAEGVNLEDMICRNLTADQWGQRLPGHNSIAWFIWHLARCEDVAVNTVLRGDRKSWTRTAGAHGSALRSTISAPG